MQHLTCTTWFFSDHFSLEPCQTDTCGIKGGQHVAAQDYVTSTHLTKVKAEWSENVRKYKNQCPSMGLGLTSLGRNVDLCRRPSGNAMYNRPIYNRLNQMVRRDHGQVDIVQHKINTAPAQHSTAQHSTAQHSTAQHSTAQRSAAHHSTAQHSTAQHSTAQQPV